MMKPQIPLCMILAATLALVPASTAQSQDDVRTLVERSAEAIHDTAGDAVTGPDHTLSRDAVACLALEPYQTQEYRPIDETDDVAQDRLRCLFLAVGAGETPMDLGVDLDGGAYCTLPHPTSHPDPCPVPAGATLEAGGITCRLDGGQIEEGLAGIVGALGQTVAGQPSLYGPWPSPAVHCTLPAP